MFNQVLVSSFFNFLLPFNSLILIRYQRVDLAFHCHRTFYFVSYRIIRIGSDIRVLITQFQCGKVAFHIFDGLVLNDSFFIFAFSQWSDIDSRFAFVTVQLQLSFNSTFLVLRSFFKLDKYFIPGAVFIFHPR